MTKTDHAEYFHQKFFVDATFTKFEKKLQLIDKRQRLLPNKQTTL